MRVPDNWWDIAFLACLPLAMVILAFAWLVFIVRGRRAFTIDLSGFGVSLRLESRERDVQAVEQKGQASA